MSPATETAYQYILVSREKDGNNERDLGVVQINRPKVLNALSPDLMAEMVEALEAFDGDDTIGCMLITGNDKAFAAGADIGEMAKASMVDMLTIDQLKRWDRIRKLKKPVISAVSGFVLGGGNELNMMCDIIVASETARFGQPEINIGVIPGAGGTQRLTRAVGKAKAMELVLTGRQFGAQEALDMGLINKICPIELYLEEAKKIGHDICTKPPLAVRLGKEAVLKSFDTTMEGGLDYERKLFYMLFATQDQKEGMGAFMEKRGAAFVGK